MHQNCGLCLAELFGLYSLRASNAPAFDSFALLRKARGSNLRSLPEKQAFRLGFARLSAPTLRDGAGGGESLLLRLQKTKSGYREGIRFCWRRRRDSDSRAGKTRPTPLAGAPLRPLEYFSVTGCRLVTCRIIISIFQPFVNTFSKNIVIMLIFSGLCAKLF